MEKPILLQKNNLPIVRIIKKSLTKTDLENLSLNKKIFIQEGKISISKYRFSLSFYIKTINFLFENFSKVKNGLFPLQKV